MGNSGPQGPQCLQDFQISKPYLWLITWFRRVQLIRTCQSQVNRKALRPVVFYLCFTYYPKNADKPIFFFNIADLNKISVLCSDCFFFPFCIFYIYSDNESHIWHSGFKSEFTNYWSFKTTAVLCFKCTPEISITQYDILACSRGIIQWV